jgi:hypothetical protein
MLQRSLRALLTVLGLVYGLRVSARAGVMRMGATVLRWLSLDGVHAL